MKLNDVYKKAIKIVKRARKVYYNQPFEEAVEGYKYENDCVTTNDLATQAFLVKHLAKLIPDCGFLGEEKLDDTKDKQYVWIMDPIDGTYNYEKSIYLFGCQVALQKDGKTIFSVLDVPSFNETYYSFEGKSFCNGKQLQTSKAGCARSVVLNISLRKRKDPFDSDVLMDYLRNKKLRIYGSSLFDFALVASGKADCLIINSSTPWDVEPGKLLAVNAGAKVLSLNKNKMMIVAGNNKILNDIEKSLRLIDKPNQK